MRHNISQNINVRMSKNLTNEIASMCVKIRNDRQMRRSIQMCKRIAQPLNSRPGYRPRFTPRYEPNIDQSEACNFAY